jgi:hypothetical protein
MLAGFEDYLVESTRIDKILFSMMAAAVSIRLSFLSPVFQFLSVSIVLVLLVVSLASFMSYRYVNQVVSSLSLLSVLYFTNSSLIAVSAVFLILSAFQTSVISGITGRYFLAIGAHLADIFSTVVSTTGSLEEANPFVSSLISYMGLSALFLVKIVFVGGVLVYTSREFDGENEELVLAAITVLGLSMAARNFLLFF